MRKIIYTLIAILALVAIFLVLTPSTKILVEDFHSCLRAGYAVMESYPRQCRTDDSIFVENIGNELEKIDLIRISNPRPNEVIKSPLVIEGEARGNWFFEGDFPVLLTDWDGKIIAEGFVSAQKHFMTEGFVLFSGTLDFEKPNFDNRGTLILQKDNPSDLSELDDALEIPVLFQE